MRITGTLQSIFVALLVSIIGISGIRYSAHAQLTAAPPQQNCYECALPKAPNMMTNTSADIIFKDGATLNNVTSVKRVLKERYDQKVQALAVKFLRDGVCRDTVLFFGDLREIQIKGLGIGGATVATPIYPAREFFLNNKVELPPASFLEITPMLGYGGSQESQRNTGFNSIYYGAEAAVAPFGRLLGNQFALVLGGGITMENSRMRFPLFGQLRFTFLGAPRIEQVGLMIPNECTFRMRDRTKPSELAFEPFTTKTSDSLLAAGYVEVPVSDQRDSLVYFARRRAEIRDALRPFLFVEGGPILNGNFEGAGRNPSVNPNDYNQYHLGAGAGLPLWDVFVLELQYRYMRLNVRTPCPTCPPTPANPDEFFIQNTNAVHSILLKAGYRLEW